MGEHELEALLEYEFRRAGGSGPAYTSIVAGGPNATVLHYVENDRPLRAGELVLVDAGTEWLHYASDVSRTWPVSGRFSPEQRELYEVVLAAQRRVLAAVRPGATLPGLHQLALESLCEGLVRLGLLPGSAEEALESSAYRRFYMHRTSHFLGLDVHDVGAQALDGSPRALAPGMVLTVEPGLYLAEDDDQLEPAWRGLGVRIEDDVHVTAEGAEVLTRALPTAVEEIEALCAGVAPAAARA
jgi:Xaa-Pro aminopeptidase